MTSSLGLGAADEQGPDAAADLGQTVPVPAEADSAAIDLKAIAAEIQRLRRGRGLRGNVANRIGPLLLELADGGRRPAGAAAAAAAGSDAAEVRTRLATVLLMLSGRLPDDLRTAILAALALLEATERMRTYEQRKAWVARLVDRVPRTAERRIDEAQRLLAQEVAGELARQRGGRPVLAETDRWHIEQFDAALLLDGDLPEAVERRVVVADVDGLAELTTGIDVPVEAGRPRLRLRLEVIKGGELVTVQELAKTRTQFRIRLPQPLRAGESHEYEMRVSVLPGEPMRDYYVFRPERRCDNFSLRVRFDRRRLPAWVRRVSGEDVWSYYHYDATPEDAELVTVDRTGEAVQEFRGLQPHYGFGLQWGWTR